MWWPSARQARTNCRIGEEPGASTDVIRNRKHAMPAGGDKEYAMRHGKHGNNAQRAAFANTDKK